MAASGGSHPVTTSSLQPSVVPSPRSGPPAPIQSSVEGVNAFPEAGKVRELALQVHSCLFQAQQLKIATAQQQPSAPANHQVEYHVVVGCLTHSCTSR
jgi:hypothetical protein